MCYSDVFNSVKGKCLKSVCVSDLGLNIGNSVEMFGKGVFLDWGTVKGVTNSGFITVLCDYNVDTHPTDWADGGDCKGCDGVESLEDAYGGVVYADTVLLGGYCLDVEVLCNSPKVTEGDCISLVNAALGYDLLKEGSVD